MMLVASVSVAASSQLPERRDVIRRIGGEGQFRPWNRTVNCGEDPPRGGTAGVEKRSGLPDRMDLLERDHCRGSRLVAGGVIGVFVRLGGLCRLVEEEIDRVVGDQVQHRSVGRSGGFIRIFPDRGVAEERVHIVPEVLERAGPLDDFVEEPAAGIEHRLDEVCAATLPRRQHRCRGARSRTLEDVHEDVPKRLLDRSSVVGLEIRLVRACTPLRRAPRSRSGRRRCR